MIEQKYNQMQKACNE